MASSRALSVLQSPVSFAWQARFETPEYSRTARFKAQTPFLSRMARLKPEQPG